MFYKLPIEVTLDQSLAYMLLNSFSLGPALRNFLSWILGPKYRSPAQFEFWTSMVHDSFCKFGLSYAEVQLFLFLFQVELKIQKNDYFFSSWCKYNETKLL